MQISKGFWYVSIEEIEGKCKPYIIATNFQGLKELSYVTRSCRKDW